MPTLQRYKKLFQDRIPSIGEGRRQRYPKRAIAEIRKIKTENLKKRGRPRKLATAGDGSAEQRSTGSSRLLTLSEICRRTGISYPTLVRYVKLYIDQIPHVGEGRKRRFEPEAVPVFVELRRNSRRGRPPSKPGAVRGVSAADATLTQRIRDLERAQREVSRQLESVLKLLKKPVQVTIQPQ